MIISNKKKREKIIKKRQKAEEGTKNKMRKKTKPKLKSKMKAKTKTKTKEKKKRKRRKTLLPLRLHLTNMQTMLYSFCDSFISRTIVPRASVHDPVLTYVAWSGIQRFSDRR